jgi:YHS domain-containing protein
MKHIISAAILALAFASCQSSEAPKTAVAPAEAAAPATPEAAAPVAASADIDPVCGMVRDSTWTDYTLYKGDTVWFCAAPEKTAFLANPEKYMKPKSM